jgi:hypothetical protein
VFMRAILRVPIYRMINRPFATTGHRHNRPSAAAGGDGGAAARLVEPQRQFFPRM